MKVKALLMAMVLLNIKALAQIPTLTASTSNPAAGEVFYRYACDTTGITDLATGAAHTWDYSGLTVSNAIGSDTCTRYTFEACGSTPYCGNYTGTTLADEEIGYQAGGTGTDTAYSYYTFNSSEYAELGTEESTGITVALPSFVLLDFPFTYNTVQPGGYHLVDEIYGADTVLGSTLDSVIGDGYGTLVLPSGTFSNVLRVHLLTHAIDTVHYSGITMYDTAYSESFLWFTPAFHMPLLAMSNGEVGGTPIQVNLYTQVPLLSVQQTHRAAQSYGIGPNPAKNLVHVAGIGGKLRYEIANVQGIGMLSGILTPANDMMDVSILPPGVYVVRLVDEDGLVSTQMLVHE